MPAVDLGIAFQAVDDALSVWGDPSRTGKPVGNDAGRGKKSLPAIIAAERSSGRFGASRDADVREATLALAGDYARSALSVVRSTSIGGHALEQLESIVTFILARESWPWPSR